MANKTVASDAAFKTYVEGLPAYASGTVYMNDDSKYWTFNKEATDKINSMCVNGDDIEVWVYDGTDWITNRIPEVVDNLTTNSAVAALSAKQGKALNERKATDYITTRQYRFLSNVTIASHGSTNKTISVALTGYTPIAVVGMAGSSNAGVVTFEYYFTGNNLLMYFENTTNASKTVTYIDVTVLYIKS